MTDFPLSQILQALQQNAAQPFSHARSMPKGMYTHPGIVEREKTHIFTQEWICVGRQETLENVGDYFSCQIADEPILVIRDQMKNLRAFSNVCMHRLSILKTGQGNCQRIVCPYHGWAYNLTGGLLGAPQMQQTPDFSTSDYQLPEIRLEIWQGWIYLTLNKNAPAVATHLSSLHDKIQQYGMQDYVETFRETLVWNTNWKILAENFMESYHLPVQHRNTIGPHSKVSEMQCPPGEAAFNYHWIRKESSMPIGLAHPSNTRLQGIERRTTALISIYPSHLITLTPGYFWYLCLQPQGPDKVNILFGGGLAPEFIEDEHGQKWIDELKVLLDEVNEEDRQGVEGVYRGACAQHASSGHLSFLERPIYDFGRYLSEKLTAK